MVFEEVERLQREYTDKYVMVNAERPELARFADTVGIIKTINYNGRALVEFLDYHLNIGWYDIGLDYLKLVPKPDPNAKKVEKEKPATKASPAAKAAAAKPAAGGKSSTADILAAARAKAGGAAAATKPAAAKPAAPAAKPAGAKLSTADILASLRAKGPASAPAADPAAETEAEEAPAAAATAEKVAAKKPAAKAAGPMPTTTAEKIEFCRRVDAQG